MDYTSFLQHIYQRHSTTVKLGLERMYILFTKMDFPNKKLKGIHIAGTNGKGSTSAICESLLIAYGNKTGLNTSPHLIDYTERFRVNGKMISVDNLMALYHRYSDLFEDCDASFFEITTALAFQYFVDEDVESAVIEVGLGGRLDGTNPFNSTISVITSISKDHTKTLGDTLEKIAFEKAGIIKQNTPVVIGNINAGENIQKIISDVAHELDAPCFIFDKDYHATNIRLGRDKTTFDYEFESLQIKLSDLEINLLGYHQAFNAATALTAFLLYMKKIDQSFDENRIRTAMKQVNWIGRLQILSKNPYVLVDGAHNEEGVSTLIKNVQQIFPDYKYHFLVSILKDKNLDNMIKEICGVAESIYISKNPSDRAADIQEQVDVAIACGIPYRTGEDIVELSHECIKTLKENEMLIITGSLYTISEVLKQGINSEVS